MSATSFEPLTASPLYLFGSRGFQRLTYTSSAAPRLSSSKKSRADVDSRNEPAAWHPSEEGAAGLGAGDVGRFDFEEGVFAVDAEHVEEVAVVERVG